MQDFLFPGLPTRVTFGRGTLARVADEIAALGHKRVLVLSTPQQADDARALAGALGTLAGGVHPHAAMHTPVDVTEAAVAAYRDSGATCTVALGGGSTVGLGKAIAARTAADQIAIPTTYAGSEMTDILGETAGGEKRTRRGPEIRPEAVIYDVDLTLGLPVGMSVTSALNALAHAIEALYAPDRNPIVEMMAAEGSRVVARALPRVVAKPDDPEARSDLLYAAWLCSTVLGQVSMSLHHKLAHVVGGTLGTPHAETHAILLPHTAGFNAAATNTLAPITDAFGGPVGPALHAFSERLGAPTSLRELGVEEGDLAKAAEIATRNPYENPRPFGAEDIEALLRAAWEGAPPAD
ncbi:MAG: maleylacetate reductase [Shimia sp.]